MCSGKRLEAGKMNGVKAAVKKGISSFQFQFAIDNVGHVEFGQIAIGTLLVFFMADNAIILLVGHMFRFLFLDAFEEMFG
jgi:hypothetical protein